VRAAPLPADGLRSLVERTGCTSWVATPGLRSARPRLPRASLRHCARNNRNFQRTHNQCHSRMQRAKRNFSLPAVSAAIRLPVAYDSVGDVLPSCRIWKTYEGSMDKAPRKLRSGDNGSLLRVACCCTFDKG
jgi:hypothetical protein